MRTERFETFPALLGFVETAYREKVFLPRRHSRGGRPVSFAEMVAEARRVAAGLLASGVGRGDRVGLISENRYEWLLADLACSLIGAADVPRGTDTTTSELLFILAHSGARTAFVETDAVARNLLERRDQIPELESICVFAAADESADDSAAGDSTTSAGALALDALRARGDALLRDDPGAVARAAAEVRPEDNLTIVYTSGTTDDPKGVMLSHRNVLSNIRMIDQVLRFDESDVFLSVLPSWHAYERIMDYVALLAGSRLVYSDRRRMKEDLKTVAPTVFAGVPRVWEMIHDGIVNHCRKHKNRVARKLLCLVVDNCGRVGAGRAGPARRLLHKAFAATVLPRFLAATGGRLRIAVSGGGSLPQHVDERLLGMGLPLLNGYGLTETSPVASVRLPADNRAGTIGPALPDTEIEIRDEQGRPLTPGRTGLIWIRGPQVMAGYYKNPERTGLSIDRDGWFDSGDLGLIEPDGHIRITGRAKDTIVLAGGENVEPERIETTLKTSPYIDQAIVVGQDRKTLGAIIVPMVECLEQEFPRRAWGEHDGMLGAPAVHSFYRREIDRLLSRDNGFRPLERVQSFRLILEPLTTENGLLTHTLKVRRHKVAERHGPLIAEMFG